MQTQIYSKYAIHNPPKIRELIQNKNNPILLSIQIPHRKRPIILRRHTRAPILVRLAVYNLRIRVAVLRLKECDHEVVVDWACAGHDSRLCDAHHLVAAALVGAADPLAEVFAAAAFASVEG